MRITSLLFLVALAALADSQGCIQTKRSKRELLLRTKRRWVLNTIELEEEKKGKYPMEISQMFNDKTSGKNHRFKISGDGVEEKLFSINATSGVVYAHAPVDREKIPCYHIRFDVYDEDTNQPIDKELAFDVEVKDINDNKPTFLKSEISDNVAENTESNYLPVQLKAVDLDQPETDNSTITFRVISQNPQEPKIDLIRLHNTEAQLKFEGCFDYDKAKKYEVIVEAKDHGKPPLSSTAVVTLNVLDRNTHPPRFKQREYRGDAPEVVLLDNVLRVQVEDKDTPNTDGWRAVYSFIEGNDKGIYKIRTDPETNEGIVSIVQEKNYKVTTNITMQIKVENAEPLFVCKAKPGGPGTAPPPDTATITIRMIDDNDPPEFQPPSVTVYQKEEDEPGKLLFTPKVYDYDSKNIRFELIKDPADWVAVDGKTGKVTAIKKMDRESPFVENSLYKVVIAAIDDGEPPATATCTVTIHLGDINDHTPALVDKSLTLCGNKANKVRVSASDNDAHPYSGPFTFSLGGDDSLKELWKLEPSFGPEGGLVSRVSLPYGNYSVPLIIKDQQSAMGKETLVVTVCDCGEGNVCRIKGPLTKSLGAAGIGLIIAGLLLFLLLLLVFACGNEAQKFEYLDEDKGNETLIKYNEEGGGSANMAQPKPRKVKNGMSVAYGTKQGSIKTSPSIPVTADNIEKYNSGFTTMDSTAFDQRESLRSHGGQAAHYTMTSNRTNYNWGNSSNYQRSQRQYSTKRMTDQLSRRLDLANGKNGDNVMHYPSVYAYEGDGSICQSLDKLSVSNLGDDLQFLDDLGPKFKNLGKICHQTIQQKNIEL